MEIPFDIGNYLRMKVEEFDIKELATLPIDGVPVTVNASWTNMSEEGEENRYRFEIVYHPTDRLQEEIIVAQGTGPLDQANSDFMELLEDWTWWDKKLRPSVDVNLLKGVASLLDDDINTPDAECYVCHDQHGDARLSCGHKICSPCFLKSLDDGRGESVANFRCGVCRNEETFKGVKPR